MKIFKLFVAVAAIMVSLGAHAADTTYNFSFTTDNNISTSGASFVYNGSSITSGSGTLIVGANAYSMTQFALVSSSPWEIKFYAGGLLYDLDYTPQQKVGTLGKFDATLSYLATTSGITSGSFAAPTVAVPEIDGSKLPQAALLILALVFMVRRLKAIRPAHGFSGQFA